MIYKKMKEYKNNLIYTIDEFTDRISSLEREDLMLIEYYTNLKYKIKDLKDQYDKVCEQNNRIFGFYYENLRNKENELNRLKNSASAMENIVNVFHNLNYYNKGLNKNNERSSLFKDEEKRENEEIIPFQPNLPQITIIKNTKKRGNKSKKKIKKSKKNYYLIKLLNYIICVKQLSLKIPNPQSPIPIK